MSESQPTVTVLANCGYIRKVTFSPGNGTCYRVVALPVTGLGEMGAMGQCEPCWIVVLGNNGRAYLLSTTGDFIAVRYVEEKFSVHGDDAHAVAACIAQLLERETDSKYAQKPVEVSP